MLVNCSAPWPAHSWTWDTLPGQGGGSTTWRTDYIGWVGDILQVSRDWWTAGHVTTLLSSGWCRCGARRSTSPAASCPGSRRPTAPSGQSSMSDV